MSEAMRLSADDVAAIKGATTYSVTLDNGRAELHLTKRIKARGPKGYSGCTSTELNRTITGDAATLANAWFCELYPRGAWTALGKLLRAGDVLSFCCAQDGSNQYMHACEIPAGKLDGGHRHGYDRVYLDELIVHVVRDGKTLIDALVLTYSVCPQNSARAYRGQGTRAAQYELVTAGEGGGL